MTRTQRFTLAATGLGLFMIFLDALIVNVALPAIQSDFKVGESGLQWVVTAYSLGMAIAIMSGGTLADIYGRRKLYLAGIALFTAASAACGMASSLEVLNLARAVQGVAAAAVNVTSLALVSAAFPDPKLKTWAIGIWTAIASTAIAIGPTLGGFMVQWTGWRSIFMVNIPVGLVAIALTCRFVAESRDERPRTFDIPGQLLFMTAVGAFAFAVIEGPRAGWLSGEILTLFVVAGAALATFIFCERRSADPMMDLKLFGDRTYSLAIITIFAAMFAVYGMLLVITQYMQNVRGLSPTDAGLLLLPYSMSLMIVSLKVGKLVGVVGSRRLILLGLTSQIVGFAVLGSILAATLTVTLSVHLADALPDPTERKEVAATIIGNANPRACSGEIGPGRPIQHLDAATQKAILAAADTDFVEGIRFSLATAMVLLAIILAAGFAWFPRGKGAIADAEREEQALESEETAREGPL